MSEAFVSQPRSLGDAVASQLETRRAVLMPSGPFDLDDIVALHADARVTPYLLDGIPDTRWKAQIYLDWAAGLHARGLGPWTARRRNDGRFLGLFTLTPVESDDDALEFGGRAARAGWSGDLAVECGACLIDHGFNGLRRARLVSLHAAANRAASVALQRLGFGAPAPATVFGSAAVQVSLTAAAWAARGRQAAPRGSTH